MIRKILLLPLALLFIVGSTLQVFGQDTDEPIWETIMLVPDNSKLKVLAENMGKHNKKYHNEGPYSASVYNINTGPDTGKLVWIMGPLKYSHLDGRPAASGHDEDWRDNIMPYVKKMQQGEYWKGDTKLSNTDMLTDDPSAYPILFTRYWEIAPGHGFGIESHFKKVSETIKSLSGEHPWGIYYNEFQQGNLGRHIATVSFHKSWTDFEKPWGFPEAFKKLHGENSWNGFIRNRDATFDNRWDEIWVYNKEMSGN